MKGKQAASQSPVKEKVAENIHKTGEKFSKEKVPEPSKGKSRVKTVGGASRPKRTPIVKKRKEPEPSESDHDSDFNVEENVSDIHPRKKPSLGKLPKVPEVAIDNISFHHPENAGRWKYVCLKRIALEGELNKSALECKDVIDLIKEAGLMKTVVKFSNCYDVLVKEFIVNLSSGCGDGRSTDYRTVYVRGRKVRFSPSVVNRFLGRSDDAQPELEETDNQIYQTITARQVKQWPLKGKLSASKLSITFSILHKIGAA